MLGRGACRLTLYAPGGAPFKQKRQVSSRSMRAQARMHAPRPALLATARWGVNSLSGHRFARPHKARPSKAVARVVGPPHLAGRSFGLLSERHYPPRGGSGHTQWASVGSPFLRAPGACLIEGSNRNPPKNQSDKALAAIFFSSRTSPRPWAGAKAGLRWRSAAHGGSSRRRRHILFARSHIASTSLSTSFASCHRWVDTRTP